MASGRRYPLFFLILAVYLLAGVLFATLTPNWQAPDEPAHYNYIHYLASQFNFPELTARCYDQAYLERLKSRRFPPDLLLDSVCYEFHQPPLYYLLATPVFLLSGGSLLAVRLLSVVLGAGVVALAFVIGQTIFRDWAAIAYGAMAFVAFVPMHVAVLASVNNDTLAELILAALLLMLIRRLQAGGQATRSANISLGILLGLGLITKTTVYIAVPLVAVTLWLALAGKNRCEQYSRHVEGEAEAPGQTRRFQVALNRADWWTLAKQGSLIYGLALAVALPWYGRNAALYGNFDILGLARHEAVVVGQPRTADFLAQVGGWAYLQNFVSTTFHSFWGQFGWMAVPMSERIYLILILLTVAAVGGLVGWRMEGGGWRMEDGRWRMEDGGMEGGGIEDRRMEDGGWRMDSLIPTSRTTHYALRNSAKPPLGTHYAALTLMALTILLMFLGYAWYNLEFVQFQGRYLFPALIPLGLFFSLGLAEAFALRRVWWLAGGLAIALAWVVITSLASGDLNKWAVLITGLPLSLALGRAWLARRWPVPAWWPLLLVYTGLALLTLISPFWYIIPYLSP